MSQPDIINTPKTPFAAAEAPPSEVVAPETAAAATNEAPAARPDASSADAELPVAASGSEGPEGENDAGDDGEEEGAAAEGTEASAEANPDGSPAKRKRRRRRKKKAPGEAGVDAAAGTPAEGEAAARPARSQQPKKERPERERPAFNVGDVVFGKVLEVTEDALFVDLSGKAKAIFDLRELLITEEEAEEYNRAHNADRKSEAAAESADAEPNDANASPGLTEAGASDAAIPTEASQAVVEDQVSASPEVSSSAVSAPAEQAPPVAAAESPAATEGEDAKAPQLPRVILEPGAPFVGLVHNDGGRGGLVVLTHHPKRVSKAKPVVADASRSGTLVFGLVTGTIKGGVEVDVDGLRAFAPASHVELRPGADLSHLVGKRLTFAVTQYAKRGRDVVLSRRAMLEAEAKEKRQEALKNITVGAVVDGIVRTIVPFGAFVDIGGVEGLVPLSEMSHNRADGPKDVFKLNEPTRVKIMNVDEKGKLWLSRRAAIEDPWGAVAQKYAPGTAHRGKVARLQPFGAFVELEPGIDGLIHTADLSVKRIEHPEELVKVGDEMDVIVANVDSRQHRIGLHPAPTGDAVGEEPQRIQLGKMVKVVVVLVENGGITVRVRGATGRNARGFISASATGTPRGTELRKLFPVGKELEAKIVEMDPRRGELKLSIKALNEETERNAYQQYRAQVKREAKFGTLADLLAKRNITPTK